jgi:N-acetyl-anhydromuramyl-L-alanine amidase AmpD
MEPDVMETGGGQSQAESREYPGALWIPSEHFFPRREGHRARWIILHGTAGGGNATDVGRFFQTNDPPTATHYVIGRDGQVVQCVAEGDGAWGNGPISEGHDAWWDGALNPNLVTLSIEHCKLSADNREELTAPQEAASFALVAHLCRAHGIPPRAADAAGGITGHRSMDPVQRRFCPGPYPWERLWRYLAWALG